jgi:transforming growth factor-beta-induced protein
VTTPPVTDPPATDPPVTDPPAQPATATEALQAAGGYGSFLGLAAGVPSVQALLDGAGPITVFAPNDAAVAAATLPEDPAEVEKLLLSHISTETLDAASLFDGRTEVAVASGGTQPVVQDPPTVGGATVVQADLASTSGVSHGIDTVLSATP